MSAEQDSPTRLVVRVPRSRLLTFGIAFAAGCGACVAFAQFMLSEGMTGRVLNAVSMAVCLAVLVVLAGYRTEFVFDAKVRVIQRRSTVFGRVLRLQHWPLLMAREVEILSGALQAKGKGEVPLARHWYQVRVGEVVVAPMLAGDKGRDEALKLARRVADHLSLRVVER